MAWVLLLATTILSINLIALNIELNDEYHRDSEE